MKIVPMKVELIDRMGSDEYLEAIRYFHNQMMEEDNLSTNDCEIVFCRHDWCSDGDPGFGEVMTFTCSRCGKESLGVPVGYSEGGVE